MASARVTPFPSDVVKQLRALAEKWRNDYATTLAVEDHPSNVRWACAKDLDAVLDMLEAPP